MARASPPPSIRSVRDDAERLLMKLENTAPSETHDLTALHELRTELQSLTENIRRLELEPEDKRFFDKVIRAGLIHLGLEFIKSVIATQFYRARLFARLLQDIHERSAQHIRRGSSNATNRAWMVAEHVS